MIFPRSFGKTISRRERNKRKHAEEGNKNLNVLHTGFLNDKTTAKHNAKTNRDLITHVLDANSLDILGISEANIWENDEKSQLKVKNYELVTDKLLRKHGRARSMLYIKSSIKYKLRDDLMSEEFPEIWLELPGKR